MAELTREQQKLVDDIMKRESPQAKVDKMVADTKRAMKQKSKKKHKK